MATKNVTVIFDRKGNLLKKGTGKVEIRRHACQRKSPPLYQKTAINVQKRKVKMLFE